MMCMDEDLDKHRFENLVVWQKAQDLALVVYKQTSVGPFAKDYVLCNQIRRAAISIFSNIAEGKGRFSRKENRHFLAIANGSTYEVISQIHFAEKLGYMTEIEAKKLLDRCSEISRMLKGLRNSINI